MLQELDPELLATVRAQLVSGYADKQGIKAMLSLLLQKVLIVTAETRAGSWTLGTTPTRPLAVVSTVV